ncbi:hypothetical protein PF001_g4458 [Phytophthora fragariae]|uniref:Uncharacterized protein n=1 Tax=Phytophthora fragariae TaxID=53985 RepID=A0A6A4EPK7_9STRA|nr:hypothetical protein PF003_g5313 [Phytophthora fragariae]KAE9322322.1 hypothetical protein PF001_g4458 [Phytophthora fragariae]
MVIAVPCVVDRLRDAIFSVRADEFQRSDVVTTSGCKCVCSHFMAFICLFSIACFIAVLDHFIEKFATRNSITGTCPPEAATDIAAAVQPSSRCA